MLSFLRSFPCGTSGEEVRQVTEVGEEGNGDIAEDNDDDGMDQGNGNTALEHFIGIQAMLTGTARTLMGRSHSALKDIQVRNQ